MRSRIIVGATPLRLGSGLAQDANFAKSARSKGSPAMLIKSLQLAFLLAGIATCAYAQTAKQDVKQDAKPAAQGAKSSPAKSSAKQSAKDEDDDDTSQQTSLNNLKDAPPAPPLACTGPFAKDTTHAKLVTEFGAKNVAFKDVELPGNYLTKATVVHDADPTKRLVFFWADEKNRTKLKSILVEAPSIWLGPGGVRNGLPLKELEKLNGGSFSMIAFGGVGSGTVSDLKGPFANVSGGCNLTVTFEPGIANPLPPRYASITGDHKLVSTNFMLRRVRAQVTEWRVTYP